MAHRLTYLLFLALPLMLIGCTFRDDEYVDFADLEAAQGLRFKVLSQRETDLSQGFPKDCFMPDGTPIGEYSGSADTTTMVLEEDDDSSTLRPKKTSSITVATLTQQLLKRGNQDRVIEIVGTYPSMDNNLRPVTLSGKVMLPKKGKPKRLILVSHYTVGSDIEAPSNCFSLEGVLVKLGYGLIIPDYMGYGITADKVHPYLVMDQTARNVLDMYLCVREWLKVVDRAPEKDDIYLMGYSQGGATTMAVEHLIETEYCFPDDDNYVKIHRVFAGGGPYDVKATYERFVTTDSAAYPVAVPLVLQGMIVGNELDINMNDIVQDWLYHNIDRWINSKRYSTGVINQLIGTTITHKILTKEGMNQASAKVAELYKAMTINSITSYNWSPEASVYIMHSIDDEVVPYTNATNAKSKWEDANIIYNFGHYGPHIATCLRFIYSVQTLLQEEENEMKKYE